MISWLQSGALKSIGILDKTERGKQSQADIQPATCKRTQKALVNLHHPTTPNPNLTLTLTLTFTRTFTRTLTHTLAPLHLLLPLSLSRALSLSLLALRVTQLMSVLDKDGDGILCRDEFMELDPIIFRDFLTLLGSIREEDAVQVKRV